MLTWAACNSSKFPWCKSVTLLSESKYPWCRCAAPSFTSPDVAAMMSIVPPCHACSLQCVPANLLSLCNLESFKPVLLFLSFSHTQPLVSFSMHFIIKSILHQTISQWDTHEFHHSIWERIEIPKSHWRMPSTCNRERVERVRETSVILVHSYWNAPFTTNTVQLPSSFLNFQAASMPMIRSLSKQLSFDCYINKL